MTDRERLREILVDRSVRLGDFTLASGARSSYYVDARRTTMSAEGQLLTGRVCLDALAASGVSTVPTTMACLRALWRSTRASQARARSLRQGDL